MNQLQVVRLTVTADNQKIALVRIPEGLDGNLEELVTAYRRELYEFAFHMLRDHDEAEEVTQESIVKAYEYLLRPYRWAPFLLDGLTAAEIKRKEGQWKETTPILNPQAWLHTIVYHTALNHLARQSKLVSLALLETNELDELLKRQERRLDQPEAALILAEDTRELHALVDALPAKYAAAINLRFFQEGSYKSIAEKLNCPLNTAKSNVRRG